MYNIRWNQQKKKNQLGIKLESSAEGKKQNHLPYGRRYALDDDDVWICVYI